MESPVWDYVKGEGGVRALKAEQKAEVLISGDIRMMRVRLSRARGQIDELH